MAAWKTLDLRQRRTYGPLDGELIVLHMIPKITWGRSERYLTGRLQTVAGRTWMNSGGSVGDRNFVPHRRFAEPL